ncbi:MAG: hypothetical protein QW103_02155 [Candidatus Pacearchaeota archaeon]
MEKKDVIKVLNLIPFFKEISYVELRSEVAKKHPNLLDNLDEIISTLFAEGYIYEPKPGYISRLAEGSEKEKPEEKVTEKDDKEIEKGTETKEEHEKEEIEENQDDKDLSNVLHHDYFPLGEGKGISIWILNNGMRMQRRVREKSTWKNEQEIFLAIPIMEKIASRIFFYLGMIYQTKKSEEEK